MRWIDDVTPHGGALNMAIDEVLLAGGGWRGGAVLRTYRWQQAERSIGYFSPIASQAPYLAGGGNLVRRLTGGGVVDHGDGIDHTYSLVFPPGHRVWAMPGEERYREIHGRVIRAMKELGVECGPAAAPALAAESRGTAGSDCYRSPVAWDVLAPDGRKLAGGGQRRRRDGLLHQGSVRAEVGGEEFRSVLAGVFEAGPGEDLCPALLDEARALVEDKYATEDWLRGGTG